MNDELEDKLKSDFRDLFNPAAKIDCEDGWADLIASFCRAINVRNALTVNGTFGKVASIKRVYQKNGLLAIDYDFNPVPFVAGAEVAVREVSRVICEMCGNKGVLCKKGREQRVLCIDHAESEHFSMF